MTDYISRLPVEIQSDICSHLADLLNHDPPAQRHSLAALRLICRAWTEPPLARMLHTLDRSLWGPKGLKTLYILCLNPSLAHHVRILNLRVSLYVDTATHNHDQECHKGPVTINFLTDSDIFLPRCWRCNPLLDVRRHLNAAVLSIISPSPLPRGEHVERSGVSKLAQLVRSILTALNRLESVSINNHFALNLTQGQINVPNDILTNDDLRIWPWLSRIINDDLLTGFMASNRPIDLFIHIHARFLRNVTARLDSTTPFPGRLSISVFEHLFQARPAPPIDARPLLATLLRSPPDPNAKYDHVHALDLGHPPHLLPDESPRDSISHAPIRLRTTSGLQQSFPSLTHLTLRSFSFDAPATLAEFLAIRMPSLTSLSIAGDETELRSGSWWEVFQQLRACPVQLTRFRLLGRRLHAWQSGLWYISSSHDPRPDPMGDSLEFDMVEKWITGKDMDNPWIKAIDRSHLRVMVWNTPRE